MMRFFGKEGMNKQKPSFESQLEGLQRTVREGSAPKVIEHLSSLIERNSGGKRSPYVLLRRAAAEIALSSFGEEESQNNAALDAADAMYELATHLRELAESVPKRAINKKSALNGLKMLTRVYGTPHEASGATVSEATPEEIRAYKRVRMDIYRFMRKGENMIVLTLVLKALKEFPRETGNFKQFLGSVADDISIRYWGLPTENITTEEEWIEDLLAEDETQLPAFEEDLRALIHDGKASREEVIREIELLLEEYKATTPSGTDMLDPEKYNMEDIAELLNRKPDDGA